MQLKRILPTENLEEKVLQFGTGVLLRGLCDYVIHKSNEEGIFNGTVVVVKSTPGSVENFKKQDNLYTHFIRGIRNDNPIEEQFVNESISRVLAASESWDEILNIAASPALKLIVSNTTEAGIVYLKEDILASPPESYPAKLTACLYNRFKKGAGGLVVIATELIPNNGKELKKIVNKQIDANNLEKEFKKWVQAEVSICSSLVDRIVPGKPSEELLKTLEYEDKLAIISEPFTLWAIEGNSKVEAELEFLNYSDEVFVKKNINKYRDLKLHLLNAPHTLMSGMAFLSGFNTVHELMNDELMEKYMTILVLAELTPSLVGHMDAKMSQRFGRQVLDRFRNPYIEHQWLDITLYYTKKMKSRVIPLIYKYYEIFGTVPHYMARCFSAYLLFMKVEKEENGKFYGYFNNNFYEIKCNHASEFKVLWENNDAKHVTDSVLGNIDYWDKDLRALPNFKNMVETHLSNMMLVGVKDVASALNVFA